METTTSQGADGSLMAEVARGNATAFRIIVEQHSPALYRLAYRLMGQASEAEDVVQEVFVRVWTHATRWRSTQGGGLAAWLRRLATNLCLDRLRRRRFISDAAAPERIDDAPGADAVLDQKRVSALASQAVQRLAPRQRAAIILTYYEELSNNAAAEVLEMNIKAFESLLVRARSTLRRFIDDAGLSPADLGGGS
jgi:RNA polymerase sigma factor (sigma-70 family)